VSIVILNFAAAPFMLLSVEDSLLGWRSVGWYGVWMVGGTLAFFYAGGRRALGKLRALVTKEKLSTDVAPAWDGVLTPTRGMSGSFQIPPPLDQVVPPQL
jgi:lysophospholipid acyltransferase